MKGERVVALTTTDTFSQKSRSFLVALDALCKHHGILLSVSGDDALQLWDLDTDVGEPWWCTGIVDMTMPDVPEDIPLNQGSLDGRAPEAVTGATGSKRTRRTPMADPANFEQAANRLCAALCPCREACSGRMCLLAVF